MNSDLPVGGDVDRILWRCTITPGGAFCTDRLDQNCSKQPLRIKIILDNQTTRGDNQTFTREGSMRKIFALACVCGCMWTGMSAIAIAEDRAGLQMATLREKLTPAARKDYSPVQKLAGSCSITCGSANYSTSCTRGICTCNCNQGCYCAGHNDTPEPEQIAKSF